MKVKFINVLNELKQQYLNEFGKYGEPENYNPLGPRENYIFIRGKIELINLILRLLQEEQKPDINNGPD